MKFIERFELEKYGANARTEVLAGLTTFFTMSYIIMVNPVILASTGMSYDGLFAATIIVTVVCTLFMALYANSPFALAPGMGINTFFAYVICVQLGFDWREALALTFVTGLIHFSLMLTGARKAILKAIPDSLKYATSAGIGFFIIFVGLKSAGLLSFISNPGQYVVTSGAAVGNSNTIPALISNFEAEHYLAVFGLFLIIALLVLEKKHNERYGAFVLGILLVTFIGIPLGVTDVNFKDAFNISFIAEVKSVAFSFFGDPGLLSLFESPLKILSGALAVTIMLLTLVVDGFSSIIAIGQVGDPPVCGKNDKRLDRALIANSACGVVSALGGTSSATTYIESVSGVAVGGRTGLSSLVTAALFALCLPFAGFFGIIPNAATAPVLIVAGIYIVSLLKRVDWGNIEDAAPSVLIVSMIPFTYSIHDGVAFGYITYIIVCAVTGKWQKVHPLLCIIGAMFTAILILRSIFNV